MFAQVFGTCTFGLNGHVITVEVDISRASPAFDIVGLPAVSVKESKERVQSAIRNSGYFFPVHILPSYASFSFLLLTKKLISEHAPMITNRI